MDDSSRRYWTCAAVVLVAAVGIRLLCHVGVRSVEPVLTARSALDVVEGRYTALSITPGAVNNARLGMVLPTAAAVRWWGIGDIPCTLWPFACGVGVIAIVLALGRGRFGDRAALLAGGLLAALPVEVLYSTQLYSDVPMSLCWAAAGLVYWRALDRRSNASAVAAGLIVGLSWIMREPGALFLGVLLAWSIREHAFGLWARAAGAAFVVFAVEAIAYAVATGHPFFRLGIMTQGIHNRYMTQDYYLTAGAVWKRVFLDLPVMLFWPGLWCGGLGLAGLVAAAALGRSRWRDRANVRLALWFCVIFVAFAVVPLRLVPFRPAMVLHPRTLAPFSVPLALFVGRWLADRRWGPAVTVLPLAVSAAGLWMLAPAQRGVHAEARQAMEAMKGDEAPLVVTDDLLSMGGHTANFVSFTRGFDPRMDVRSLVSADPALLPGAYVLVDTATLNEDPGRYPPGRLETLLAPPADWKCLYRKGYPHPVTGAPCTAALYLTPPR